jgi:hypothetical protein
MPSSSKTILGSAAKGVTSGRNLVEILTVLVIAAVDTKTWEWQGAQLRGAKQVQRGSATDTACNAESANGKELKISPIRS